MGSAPSVGEMDLMNVVLSLLKIDVFPESFVYPRKKWWCYDVGNRNTLIDLFIIVIHQIVV